MFETNTASCGGFAGLSNSFGATLWATDYGLQLAFANFSNALLHIGGQNVFYNPFTSPPTNQAGFNQWTVGGVYYSAIVLAEAFGTSNTSRVMDLNPNGGNEYTPAYAIYEYGALSKVAVFNYVDDRSGASNLSITLAVQGGSLSSTVKVKYLEAPSVSTRDDIKWAGQTMGRSFQADGRFKGTLNITTIACTLGTCTIPLPAHESFVFGSNCMSLLILVRHGKRLRYKTFLNKIPFISSHKNLTGEPLDAASLGVSQVYQV